MLDHYRYSPWCRSFNIDVGATTLTLFGETVPQVTILGNATHNQDQSLGITDIAIGSRTAAAIAGGFAVLRLEAVLDPAGTPVIQVLRTWSVSQGANTAINEHYETPIWLPKRSTAANAAATQLRIACTVPGATNLGAVFDPEGTLTINGIIGAIAPNVAYRT